MVFAIPDWEDGNIRKNTIFSEKTKGNHINGSPKNSPQNKASLKKAAKENGVAEKSKLINKENNKRLLKQKQKGNNKTKKVNAKVVKGLHRNDSKDTKNQETCKNTKKLNKQNEDQSKNKNVKKDSSDSSLKVENLDTDKLDEVLLNAKKKKFNEALKKDDVEDQLFREDKSPEVVKKKPHEQNSKIRKSNGVETKSLDIKKRPFTERKQKKILDNKIVKAKTVKKADTEVFKVKPAVSNLKEKNNNKPHVQTRQDKKKEKLKLILKEDSNRNPINFNRNKLRERMLDRLKSAQFRFLNEKLYTSSGREASELFQNDPTAFHNYHEGYQQQLKKWPVNPLDIIVKRIQKMPKSHLIADMGCGSAALARRVAQAVRSFDLVSAAAGVEACDMAHTPLRAASVDVVVYCLALMGTELTKYLLEANRVLKTGGHLLIAEVESRFTDVNAFTKEVARLGFKLQKLDNEREVFFFMEFVKNQDPPVKKSKLPMLTLKPCIYKRR